MTKSLSKSNALSELVTLNELLRAYRKAKVDVYYERDQELAHDFAAYEKNITRNLSSLRRKIHKRQWHTNPELLGTVQFGAKSISPDPDHDSESTVHTGRDGRWNRIGKKPTISFRAHSHCTVDWHVISALWIAQVGCHFDALLDSNCRGNRVRRITPRPENESNELRPYHQFALGSFESYLPGYRKWRDTGLQTIKTELLETKSPVIAITADLKAFYHMVHPGFMLTRSFLNLLPESLTLGQAALHEDFISSLRTWAQATGEVGLPVGLGASRVIANCILIEFDRAMTSRVNPLYYGRYVDDIFLVLRDQGGLETLQEVWEGICPLLNLDHDNLVSVTPIESDPEASFCVQLKPSYIAENHSNLLFEGKKQKAFFLDVVGGPTLLASIQEHIREGSSMHRLVPELDEPEELADLAFLSHAHSPAETPDVLRKADAVSIRRSRFALRLRDLEEVCEDLPAIAWQGVRNTFIETVAREIIDSPAVFDFLSYLPRVFSLAVSTNDLNNAKLLVKAVDRAFSHLEGLKPKNDPDLFPARIASCRARTGTRLLVSLSKAWPDKLVLTATVSERWERFADQISRDFQAPRVKRGLRRPPKGVAVNSVAHAHHCLFVSDLATRPFRRNLFRPDARAFLNQAPLASPSISKSFWWVPDRVDDTSALRDFLNEYWGFSGRRLPLPFLFPTRPFSFPELTQLAISQPSGRIDGVQIGRSLQALRGTFCNIEPNTFGTIEPTLGVSASSWLQEQHFPSTTPNSKVRIALACFLTKEDSFRSSVRQLPEPTGERYKRATKLINDIIRSKEHIDYIIFPELSLREAWFRRFALRLARSGISFIAGLDHQKDFPVAPSGPPLPMGGFHLINQVRCSLVTNAPGYPNPAYYLQNKQDPAPIEREELRNINNSKLVPGLCRHRFVLQHGAWRFALLICNELTDLAARLPLRGAIDGLIVPEWNRDVNSFNALVEATSIDLPAYVVQINNRCYGDSRVRQPHQDPWQRDLTQVKGGEIDYFTIVTLDIRALRFFQNQAVSPPHPFKPVPTGFRLHPARFQAQP